MKQRAITAAVIALAFIPLLLFEVLLIPFEIAIGFLAMIAVYELIRMFEKEQQLNWFTKAAIFIFTAGFYILVGNVWEVGSNTLITDLSSDLSLILLTSLMVLFILSILSSRFDGKSLGLALLIITYIGLGFGSLVVLRVIGSRYVVYLLLTTVLTDTFAYLFGVKFGKHKMAPNISPKKSWEGAVAGTVIATIIGSCFALLYFLIPAGTIFNPTGSITILHGITSLGSNPAINSLEPAVPIIWQQALIIVPLTFIISIFGQLGDLFASKLKRTYDVKDFGEIFPGHGGVLDRFDSTIFAAMFLLFTLRILSELWPAI